MKFIDIIKNIYRNIDFYPFKQFPDKEFKKEIEINSVLKFDNQKNSDRFRILFKFDGKTSSIVYEEYYQENS